MLSLLTPERLHVSLLRSDVPMTRSTNCHVSFFENTLLDTTHLKSYNRCSQSLRSHSLLVMSRIHKTEPQAHFDINSSAIGPSNLFDCYHLLCFTHLLCTPHHVDRSSVLRCLYLEFYSVDKWPPNWQWPIFYQVHFLAIPLSFFPSSSLLLVCRLLIGKLHL